MRLLLDTHVLLALLDKRYASLPAHVFDVLRHGASEILVSVASLWEITIKCRLGKLPLELPPGEIPGRIAHFDGMMLVDITPQHVIEDVIPLPDTRDPFDRLLLAVALIEDARLLTIDSKLVSHPLAWRPA